MLSSNPACELIIPVSQKFYVHPSVKLSLMHIICYPDKGVFLSITSVNVSDSGTYICCPNKNRTGNTQNRPTKGKGKGRKEGKGRVKPSEMGLRRGEGQMVRKRGKI